MLNDKTVTTVNLNPCIDVTIYTDTFHYGGTNRVTGVREDISGKGINTNVVLQNLGIKNTAAGFSFRDSGNILEQFLNSRGIEKQLIKVPGQMRRNYKIFNRADSVMSEFNSRGELISSEDCEKACFLIKDVLKYTSILILSGSLPPGVPKKFYREIAAMARKEGVSVIADSSGEVLLETIQEMPLLIKPNIEEFRETFHTTAIKDCELICEANKIIRKGVKYVCISKGSKGALLVSRNKVYKAEPVPVEAKGIQGAGDSMVAGFCYAIEKGYDESEYLRYAVAAATGSLLHEGTQLCEKEDMEQLKEQVKIFEQSNGG